MIRSIYREKIQSISSYRDYLDVYRSIRPYEDEMTILLSHIDGEKFLELFRDTYIDYDTFIDMLKYMMAQLLSNTHPQMTATYSSYMVSISLTRDSSLNIKMISKKERALYRSYLDTIKKNGSMEDPTYDTIIKTYHFN